MGCLRLKFAAMNLKKLARWKAGKRFAHPCSTPSSYILSLINLVAYAVFGAGAQLPRGALNTDLRIAAIFPVTVPVGGAVGQNVVCQTQRNH